MSITDEAYSDFDSPIGEEADSGGFVILKPGVYPFSIEEPVVRERFSGSEKMPPCWKATVKLVTDGGEQGKATVFYSLFLTKNQSWKIKQLFVGLGLVDKDDKNFTPPWNKIVGCTGAVETDRRTYNGNTYNDVKRILPPNEAAEAIAQQISGEPAQPTFSFPGA